MDYKVIGGEELSATTETKEIGIDTGIGIGTFYNTEYIDGFIQLIKKDSSSTYVMEGYWESEIIDLVDRFKEYDSVALDKMQQSKDVHSILTRVSDDGISFDNYVATTPEGKIQSEMKRFIQIKINFYAGLTDENILVSDFNSPEDINNLENNQFVEAKQGLKIKREYECQMNKDSNWNEEGSLHRKVIKKSEWKKIDSIGVRDV